jgi:hypothetical protein
MQQVKIFKAIESDVPQLERQINAFLRDNPDAKVVQMTGNIAPQTEGGQKAATSSLGKGIPPSDVLVILLYETT